MCVGDQLYVQGWGCLCVQTGLSACPCAAPSASTREQEQEGLPPGWLRLPRRAAAGEMQVVGSGESQMLWIPQPLLFVPMCIAGILH